MENYNHSFLIARFQPFHNGHKSIIDKMIKESKYITIILGSAQESGTEKNPLTVEQRKKLIENLYGKRDNIKIFPLVDLNIPDKDGVKWYNFVKDALKKNSAEFGFPDAYYCGDLENGSYYDKGEFKIINVKREEQIGNKKISATEIRNMINNHDERWKDFIPKENIKLIEEFFYK